MYNVTIVTLIFLWFKEWTDEGFKHLFIFHFCLHALLVSAGTDCTAVMRSEKLANSTSILNLMKKINYEMHNNITANIM